MILPKVITLYILKMTLFSIFIRDNLMQCMCLVSTFCSWPRSHRRRCRSFPCLLYLQYSISRISLVVCYRWVSQSVRRTAVGLEAIVVIPVVVVVKVTRMEESGFSRTRTDTCTHTHTDTHRHTLIHIHIQTHIHTERHTGPAAGRGPAAGGNARHRITYSTKGTSLWFLNLNYRLLSFVLYIPVDFAKFNKNK